MTKTTTRGRRKLPSIVQNTPQNFICMEFVLDETGSMSSCANATVAGFNKFVDEQRSVSGLCQMSLSKFEGGNIKTPYEDLELSMVPSMTSKSFTPGGMTNLYDAIGNRITSLEQRIGNWVIAPDVLIVVMTDGSDNSSRTYNMESIRALITAYQARGWTFVYLGADQNALQIAEKLGFQEGNIKSFASKEMEETMSDLSARTTVYRTTAPEARKGFYEER
jgi:hypothetical protein